MPASVDNLETALAQIEENGAQAKAAVRSAEAADRAASQVATLVASEVSLIAYRWSKLWEKKNGVPRRGDTAYATARDNVLKSLGLTENQAGARHGQKIVQYGRLLTEYPRFMDALRSRETGAPTVSITWVGNNLTKLIKSVNDADQSVKALLKGVPAPEPATA